MAIDITKEKFDEFKRIQKDGSYNMLDPRARAMTDLSSKEWTTIMREYSKLDNAWGNHEIN